jgi:3',5'-cyclic-nucleotide phosphodiesterase
VDSDILLDAGTGAMNLPVDELSAIDHVFLTHAHLDHVAGLALLVDAVRGRKGYPLVVHATEPVVRLLKESLFNWRLWPDFSEIPSAENPVMTWQVMAHGETVDVNGRSITCLPVTHTEGSSAYLLRHNIEGFLFTGDMCSTPELWRTVSASPGISKVIVDCSFPNAEASLADLSRHFCPASLLRDVVSLPLSTELLIYHLKPGQEEAIMQELRNASQGRSVRALACDEVFEF